MPQFVHKPANAAEEVGRFVQEIKDMGEDAGQFSKFYLAYIEAMFFAPSDDEVTTEHDLSLGAISRSITEVWAAWICMRDIINDDEAYKGNYDPVKHAGHDLWLTRNGHGSGFWDGDWAQPQADKLCEVAKIMGQSDVYLGDDGLVYLM